MGVFKFWAVGLIILSCSGVFAKNTSGKFCSKIFVETESSITKTQIRNVVQAVRSTFKVLREDPTVLPTMWANQNAKSKVESEGFCFIAANAVYHMLGGKAAGLTPMVAKYFDAKLLKNDPESQGIATHWWLRKEDGTIIDPTADQYTAYGKKPPYHLGKGAGFNRPLKVPTKAGKKMMDLAIPYLREKGIASDGRAL